MSKGKDTKPHIGIFGKRNQGKSTLINALTGQEIAIVSEVPGTTTDPVKKTMELKGVGPVVWIDTAGIDDTGSLGSLRVEKTLQAAETVDLAILVFSENQWGKEEEELADFFKSHKIPCVVVHSKSDKEPLQKELKEKIAKEKAVPVIEFSQYSAEQRSLLFEVIHESLPESSYTKKSLLGDVLKPQDLVLLITPIDSAAPEGRLILPQVQVIRDILDNNCMAVVCKENEVEAFFKRTTQLPDLVVTDSQVFDFANKVVPQEVPLTSFSIVLARNKGLFEEYLAGTPHIDQLKDNDTILILESCTHQVSCEDIGRVKLPNLFRKYTQKQLNFEVVAGLTKLPKPITHYAMVVQCGGCVVTHKQLVSRLLPAIENNIPVSNYGMAIAYMQGIFKRGIQIFKNV